MRPAQDHRIIRPNAAAHFGDDLGRKACTRNQIAAILVATLIRSLPEELVNQGHEVTLYASGDSVTSADLKLYSGLVHKTAAINLPTVPLEFDDIVQHLWLKVMYALERYDPQRFRMTERAYVFMAVADKAS